MIRARRAIAASFVGAVACTGVWTVLPGLPRACAAGQLHVAVVVDFGDNGAGVSSVCVPASAHDNGATVLAARASMLGTPQPRFNASGLLCAIDGVPATGCGEPVGKKYAYWSYWHGDGGWSYSDVGPAASRVDASVVEGWRWNSMGAGNPTDPAPRGSANPSATCTPPGLPNTVRPAGPTGPSPSPLPSLPSSSLVPSGNPSSVTTMTRLGDENRTHVPTTARDRTRTAPRTTRATTTSTTGVANAVAARAPGRRATGPPVGLVIGGVLVALLTASGIIAARRRRRTT